LKERKLWYAENPRTGTKINLRCNAKDGEVVKYLDGSVNQHCCHFHILHRQPDFKMQKPSLEESVLASGHIFDLYPKFHCETNWIERYWGAAKWKARKECDYTFDSLKQNLNSYLDDVGIVKVSLHMADPPIHLAHRINSRFVVFTIAVGDISKHMLDVALEKKLKLS